MEMDEIQKEANKIIKGKNKEKLVGHYIDLLEIKKQTEKQLFQIQKKIKTFKKDPDGFCEENDDEDLW